MANSNAAEIVKIHTEASDWRGDFLCAACALETRLGD